VKTPVCPSISFAGNRNHTEEAKPFTSPHQKLYPQKLHRKNRIYKLAYNVDPSLRRLRGSDLAISFLIFVLISKNISLIDHHHVAAGGKSKYRSGHNNITENMKNITIWR
jgi:hypothetical protein